jgi:hypothetical protein
VRWATHDVKFHHSGTKQFHHPLVGALTLVFESLELPADPGLSLLTYTGRTRIGVRAGAGRTRSLGRHACEIVSGRR